MAGKAAQHIMLPVSQKMDVLAGTPEVYGTLSKDKEATISVPLTNMGRATTMNIRVLATDCLLYTSHRGTGFKPPRPPSSNPQKARRDGKCRCLFHSGRGLPAPPASSKSTALTAEGELT